MTETTHRILVIDDNAAIHTDFRKILCGVGAEHAAHDQAEAALFGEAPTVRPHANFEIDSAYQGQEGLKMVREAVAQNRPYAMAFVDVRMPPGWDGVETIGHIWRDYPELQVVICTAYSDYSWEDIVQQLGKSDNLVILKKPFDNVEVLQLAHALSKKWVLAQQVRYRMEDLDRLVTQRTRELQETNKHLQDEISNKELITNALRVSEERFAKAFRASPIPLAILKLPDDSFLDINDCFLEMTGYSRDEVVGRTPRDLRLCEDEGLHRHLLGLLLEGKRIRNQEVRLLTKAGKLRETLTSMEVFHLGTERHALMIAHDVTERLNLENQLRQAQKMEAVGQLAAGVAHDFNNMLTVIQGHTSLLLLNDHLERKMAGALEQVAAATDRAAALTRQLLAFSRRQIMQTRALDLNELIANLIKMLQRLIGENISLRCEYADGLQLIRGDVGCLEQVLMNLAVNGRDAMPKGGCLLIRTANVMVDPARASGNPEAKTGPHVCMSVSDTGVGIPPEIRSRLFEPFFTTKDVGKGTGLGLATVYGIMKQHEGWIEVSSQVGTGTTFSLFVPVAAAEAEPSARPAGTPPPPGAHKRILVVEDDQPLRELTCEVLRQQGYRVFPANDGTEALQIWNEMAGDVDLLFTDVVMPGGISGRRLGQMLLGGNSRLRVLLTSAYPSELTKVGMGADDRVYFLAKPYDVEQLRRLVGKSLEVFPAAPAPDPKASPPPKAETSGESAGSAPPLGDNGRSCLEAAKPL